VYTNKTVGCRCCLGGGGPLEIEKEQQQHSLNSRNNTAVVPLDAFCVWAEFWTGHALQLVVHLETDRLGASHNNVHVIPYTYQPRALRVYQRQRLE
jgi:hypothetical protein